MIAEWLAVVRLYKLLDLWSVWPVWSVHVKEAVSTYQGSLVHVRCTHVHGLGGCLGGSEGLPAMYVWGVMMEIMWLAKHGCSC